MKRVINEVLTGEQIGEAIIHWVTKRHKIKPVGPVSLVVRPIPCIGGVVHSIVIECEDSILKGRFEWTPPPE